MATWIFFGVWGVGNWVFTSKFVHSSNLFKTRSRSRSDPPVSKRSLVLVGRRCFSPTASRISEQSTVSTVRTIKMRVALCMWTLFEQTNSRVFFVDEASYFYFMRCFFSPVEFLHQKSTIQKECAISRNSSKSRPFQRWTETMHKKTNR